MLDLTYLHCEGEDERNQRILVKLWGDSLKKLTPQQRQLVVEILSHLDQTSSKAY